jgi:hypothetical protein
MFVESGIRRIPRGQVRKISIYKQDSITMTYGFAQK